MKKRCLLIVLSLVLVIVTSAAAQQKTILFDAAHKQTAGNADWTLDEDTCGTAQRFPTPDQAGITPATPETFWSGAHSAMGIDLVKKGFHVESLPAGARISFGDSTNAQDLSHYNVFVMPEPNVALTPDEIAAIRNFVQNGGGLFMIADHAGADRNGDGIDAAGVFNALMGNPSVFGITYNDNKNDKVFGWFDDAPDGNFTTDASSPIIKSGAFGVPSSSRGLGLFGSSTMTISGAAKGHVWKTTSTHDSAIGVTYATSTFGSGRVAAIGDSSVTEDATNGCGHKTFLGYNDPKYDNGLLVANGIAWLANGGGVSQPPQPPQPPGNGNGGNGEGTDISGWKVTQANSTITFTIPAGTVIPANGYVVIARSATKSAFESFWGVTLGANVVYLNSAGAFPQINGSESYTLKNKSGTVVDGPTISMPSGAMKDLQRKDPCTSAHTSSNWTTAATTSANPGSGGGSCGKGLIINEFSDAVTNFNLEFVELRNDH